MDDSRKPVMVYHRHRSARTRWGTFEEDSVLITMGLPLPGGRNAPRADSSLPRRALGAGIRVGAQVTVDLLRLALPPLLGAGLRRLASPRGSRVDSPTRRRVPRVRVISREEPLGGTPPLALPPPRKGD